MSKKRLAIFASGNGGNLQAILEAIQRNEIEAEVKIVVCDHPGAYCIKRAEQFHIPTLVFSSKDFASKRDEEDWIIKHLLPLQLDYLCLAGYMRILSKKFVHTFPNQIINIHPALLPAFKGAHGILDAFQYGVKVMGVTIHYVDEEVDHGKIIAQDCFHVEENDTLETVEEKIHAIEHPLYVQVLKKLCHDESC